MNTYLSTGTDKQRTDVQGCTTLIGGNPLLVQANHLLHHLSEQFCRYLGHHDATTGGLQTSSILVNTENAHLAIFATIGLQTFEGFLTIMQAGCSHVQIQILVRANFNFTPLAVTIVTAYVVVGFHVTE